MRALKQQGQAAGALIQAHEANMQTVPAQAPTMETVRRVVPVDWTDYNGHMNEGRYGQVFSDAADGFMLAIGADQEYVAGGHSFFTLETTIKYLLETHAGEDIGVYAIGPGASLVRGTNEQNAIFHFTDYALDLIAKADAGAK